MISQQKYLEYLETNKRAEALLTLRQEIASLDIEPGRLHNLSRWAPSDVLLALG